MTPQDNDNQNEEYDDPLFQKNRFEEGVDHYLAKIGQLPTTKEDLITIDRNYLADFNSWCQFSLWLGDCQQAQKELLELLEKHRERLADYPFQYALALYNLANINFYLGYYQRTWVLADEGISQLANWQGPKERKQILLGQLKVVKGKGIWKRGDQYMALLTYIEALSHYQKALREGLLSHVLSGRLVCLIGQLYAEMEKPQFAIELLQKGIRLLEKRTKLDKNHLYIAAAYNILGKCHLLAGGAEHLTKAESSLHQAENMFDVALQGRAHRYRASITGNKGLQHLLQAKQNRVRQQDNPDKYMALAQGAFESELGGRERAFGQDHHPTIARAYSYLADIHLYFRQHVAALRAAQQGIIAVVQGFVSMDMAQNPEIDFEYIESTPILRKCLFLKAKALYRLYLASKETRLLKIARQTLLVADELIQQMRQHYVVEHTKFVFVREIRPIVELQVKVLFQLKYTEKEERVDQSSIDEAIFQVLIKSKAPLLLEAVERKNGHSPRSDDHKALLDKINWRTIPAKLTAILEQQLSPSDREAWFAELAAASKRSAKREKDNSPEGVKLHQLCNHFKQKKRGMILSYLECEDDIFVMLVGCQPDFFELVKLGQSKPKLGRLTRDLLRRLNHEDQVAERKIGHKGTKADFSLISIIADLYQFLIAPLSKFLNGVERIYIIPDEDTSLFPFELLAPLPEKLPLIHELGSRIFNELHYLIKQFQISYYPSVATLFKTHSNGQNEVLSNRFQNSTIDLLSVGVSARLENGLLMPFDDKNTEMGLDAVKAYLKPQLERTYVNLNRSQPLLTDLQRSKVAHFFVHTLNDKEADGEMLIVLKAFNESEKGIVEEAILRQRTVRDLKMEAQLLLLNACKAGWGIIAKGEGPITWSRVFLEAGAKNIYFTSLRIDSYTAKKMIGLFLKYAVKGKTFAEALQLAKLEVIQKEGTAHPDFWASPVFIGSQITSFASFHSS